MGMLQIFIASTAAFLTAGRFGLAPTAKKHTKAGVKLYDDDSEGQQTSCNRLCPLGIIFSSRGGD